jgi:Mg-chelatase subunit ChlD
VPVDISLVLDGSSSIDSRSWNQVKQFCLSLLTTVHVADNATHVGVVQFSDYAQVEDTLDGDEARVQSDIQNMRKMDLRTAIAQGIDLGQTQFDKYGRASVPHIMILMTDGQNNEPGSPLNSANAAKAKGTEVFIIGVGSGIDPRELQPLASLPLASHYFTAASFADLQAILANLTSYTCNFYKCQDSTGTCQIVPRGTPGASSKADCDSSCKKKGGDYVCNVELLTCEVSPSGGTDLPTCQADCQVHTPAVLVGDWRGLQINKGFTLGEFDVSFTNDNMTLSAPGLSYAFKVRSNGSELTLIDSNGNIRMANYGVAQGPVTMYATIAFGAANSSIPITDFDTAMQTGGDFELVLASCLTSGKGCDFSKSPIRARNAAQAGWKSIRVMDVEEDEEVAEHDDDLKEFDMTFNFVDVEDDPPQQLCSVPADVMFVIDGSGSIQAADWQNMLNFALNLTNDLNVTDTQAHVGAFEFSGAGAGKLIDKLDGQRTAIDAAIQAMATLGGRTAIGDGIHNAQQQLQAGRAGVPHLMILMTDGVENEDTHPIEEATAAKAAGTEIVILAIGKNVDIPSLTAIASQPTATHLFTPADYASLQKYVLSVLDTVCPQPIYLCQNNTNIADPAKSNGTCVQVAPGTPGATSLTVCNQTCSDHPPPPPPVPVDKYLCDNQTLTCMKVNASTPGSQTMEACNQTCGHHSPIALTGEWRGVEISEKFVRGEWDLNITEFDMTLRNPAGEISYGYVLASSAFQFGIDYQKGPGAGQHAIGMFLPTEGPETEYITLALSAPGVSTLPASFDACMTDASTIVLNMAKCLPHKPCDFSAAMPAPPTME